MAIKKSKTNTTTATPKKLNFKLSSQQKLIFGSFLIILGILFPTFLQAKQTKAPLQN
jgi:DNA segregation ATPase FtsK/SpoIIIE, S-DNA-T family